MQFQHENSARLFCVKIILCKCEDILAGSEACWNHPSSGSWSPKGVKWTYWWLSRQVASPCTHPHAHIAEMPLRRIPESTTYGAATSRRMDLVFMWISVLGDCTFATKMNCLFCHYSQWHHLTIGLDDLFKVVTDNMLTSECSWVWPESTQQVCSWITMQLAQEILLISLELAKEEERQESGKRRKREKERKKNVFSTYGLYRKWNSHFLHFFFYHNTFECIYFIR